MAVNYSTSPIDPTYLDMWEKATRDPNGITIPIADRGEFQRLRFKLYHTRKCMEAQRHALYPVISKYSVTSAKKGDTFTLTVGPTDAKLKTYLESLGFGKGDTKDIDPDLDPTK